MLVARFLFVCAGTRDLRVTSYWIDTLVLRTEGNTYATLLHHPFLFKGKPMQAQEVAAAPHFPSPSLSLPLFPLRWKEEGGRILLGLGVQVGLPPWRTPSRAGLLSPSFIYVGGGNPKDTQVDLLAVCGAPLHHNPPRSYRCSA